MHSSSVLAPDRELTRRSTWYRLALATVAAATIATLVIAPAAAQAATSHPIGSYEKYPWSSTLYKVGTPWTATAVTYAQWQAAGSPGYRTTLVLGSSVTTYLTNPSDIYIGPWVDDTHPRVDLPHHVNAAEWAAVGYPSPTRSSIGFIKTASSPNIYACGNTSSASLISYATWQAFGTPTPVVVPNITARCP